MVGEAIATKLVAIGHQVCMGSRSAANEKAAAWVARHETGASNGTFADASAFGEMVFVCTVGTATLEALGLAGAANLAGKVVVDLTNPLDFSKGMPPTLFVGNDDSLGERVQRAFPEVRVVKTLNTVNCNVMVDPSLINGSHTMFLCGNDAPAKSVVLNLLESFGWRDVLDLGDITGARSMEAVLPLWLRLWKTLQSGTFNLQVVR